MPSAYVGAHPTLAGVVGTWLGTGFPDLLSKKEVSPMSLCIENESMSLEVDGRVIATARFSQHAAADGHGAWIVSCHPRRLLTRNRAITALTVIELVETGYSSEDPLAIALWRNCGD
jgi:hypothetical protein